MSRPVAHAQARAATFMLARRGLADGSQLVEVGALAREAGIHPDLALRLVRMGLLEPAGGTAASPLFPRDAAARLARAVRLRHDLGLNYAGAVLVCQLLGRIEELEQRLSRYERSSQRPR